MKPSNTSKRLTDEQIREALKNAPLKAVRDPENPETTEEYWQGAFMTHSLPELLEKVRGKQKTPTKVPVSIRLSAEVLAHFKASGAGWQSRIDEVLRRYVDSQQGR